MLYRCYAKINLTLEIVRKREDGFHELASLIHTISLADDLHVEPANELLTRVEGLVIDPETNLVSRAAELLTSTTGAREGAELSLVKRIPSAAGLGGGSSDAAATLVALNSLWGTRLRFSEVTELAAELGSDVPFFVRGGAALMRGRGDELNPLPPLRSQWLVLVVPPHDIADKTKRMYAALSPADFSSGEATLAAAEQLRDGVTPDQAKLRNGFERAARAVFTNLSETWAEAERICDRRFFLSGAGPALFAFATDRADAQLHLAELARGGAAAFAVRTVKHARASVKFSTGASIGYP